MPAITGNVDFFEFSRYWSGSQRVNEKTPDVSLESEVLSKFPNLNLIAWFMILCAIPNVLPNVLPNTIYLILLSFPQNQERCREVSSEISSQLSLYLYPP